ncbi:MAG: type II toxin-antitoxin system VapC family toxin [Deltaproteobacteria bacterium]|nr:type II toxin-antitoxin system VapC family toxin [Deltaproteobacteria bacterium]
MIYLLDTNICIAIIKNCPPEVKKKMLQTSVGEIAISSIVLAELWYGVELSEKQTENRAALYDFLQYVVVLDWPEQASREYGKIRAHLKKKGAPIGANDLFIAAHALALNAILISDNAREFSRIPELELENWIAR